MKMPNDNIDTIMFAPCGVNCLLCYRHCNHKKSCLGCLKGDLGKPEHCRKCKIKECVKTKGFAYCFECDEFPCKRIKYLEKSYNLRYQASLISNGKYVKEFGLEKFMEKQKEDYTCKYCGGVISIHERICSECKEQI